MDRARSVRLSGLLRQLVGSPRAWQMANEPVYVDGGEGATPIRSIYYHYRTRQRGARGDGRGHRGHRRHQVAAGVAYDCRASTTAGRASVRCGLRARRSRVVLSLQPLADDRSTGSNPRCHGPHGADDRPAGEGGGERRLVAPSLRHLQPPAIGPLGHPGGLRLSLAGRAARAETRRDRRGAPAPVHLDEHAGHARRLEVVEPVGCARRGLRVDPSSDGTTADGPRVRETQPARSGLTAKF